MHNALKTSHKCKYVPVVKQTRQPTLYLSRKMEECDFKIPLTGDTQLHRIKLTLSGRKKSTVCKCCAALVPTCVLFLPGTDLSKVVEKTSACSEVIGA